MAIEFARSHVISRSSGHSAVKAAAYRSGECLADDRLGVMVDYSHRADEVGHSEVLLPAGADPELFDRKTLWDTIEAREDQHNRRASAQLAIDHIIALPIELSPKAHIDIARRFAQEQFVSRGLVVDLAIHYHSEGNPHAHLMTSTRPLTGAVFGAKDRQVNGQFFGGVKIPEAEQIRHRWAEFQNAYFLEHGIDAQVVNNNGQFKAEVHLGPAHAMSEKGYHTAIQEHNALRISAREQALLAHPEIVIDRVSDRKSLFSRHDLYRELHGLVNNPVVFANVKAAVDSHTSLIAFELSGREHLTTQSVLNAEMDIRVIAEQMARPEPSFKLNDTALNDVLDGYELLSHEQRDAAVYLGESHRISCVVGLAGAGKSSMLKALNEAYSAKGHRVQGLTLAGKASEELQQSAAIESRTIASWLMAIKQGIETVERGDVLVMDEAGMVNNKTMLSVLTTAHSAGAKLILVGDAEQLQPIQAGAPFRDISTQNGYVEIGTVRRQRAPWQREATQALARGDGARAVQAYHEQGHVHACASVESAIGALVSDYLDDDSESRIILAHRIIDVAALNSKIRDSLVSDGKVVSGLPFRSKGAAMSDELSTPFDLRAGDPIRFGTTDSTINIEQGDLGTYIGFSEDRHHVRTLDGTEWRLSVEDYGHIQHRDTPEASVVVFGAGDRVLFSRNDKLLDVKNGTLGTVISTDGHAMLVQVDERKEPVFVQYDEYSDVQLGYAATVHKSQGMTVDRAFVLGTNSMDKHLGYVSMSRHRDQLDVYVVGTAERFGQTVSQTKRQETVLDVAERHGIELDPTQTDPFSFTPITPSEEKQDMRIEAETNPDSLLVPPSSTLDEATSAVKAQESLDAEVRNYLVQIDRQQAQKLLALTERVNQTADELKRHTLSEPKAGLFTSKKLINQWRAMRRELEISHNNARSGEKRVIDKYRSELGHRQYLAEEAAKKALPKAATLVAQHDARVLSRQLVERWRTLEKDLVRVSRGEHLGVGQNEASVRQSLEHVFRQIEQSKLVKQAIGKQLVVKVLSASRSNTKLIEQQKALDKGRGLGR